MISLESVSKSYGNQKVLREISLSFEPGRTYVLLGASGCGKSTLLRLVAGLIEPDAGRILIGDAPMTAKTQRQLCGRIGYVIQDGGLFPHLTVEQNVALVARLAGWSTHKIAARINALLEMAGFEQTILKRFPKQLSGGQKQRVAVMRALMMEPQLLLLDEPLGALDPIVRADLQLQLKELFAKVKKTALLVTHDIGEAALLGDEIILFHQGAVVQRGAFRELLENPASPYVTEYLHAQKPPKELGMIR